MDKKSKSISGLIDGRIIIQKPNKYFNDSRKTSHSSGAIEFGLYQTRNLGKTHRTTGRTRTTASVDAAIRL